MEPDALDVSVVIPARNAARWLPECLESVRNQRPREVIVIDGCSEDSTVKIARSHGALVLSDEGRGLSAARMLGVHNAACPVVALIDSDVVLPKDSLKHLVAEFEQGGYDGLQSGLVSESDGAGYWGEALAWHHNRSRARLRFGVCATLLRRDVLLEAGFDEEFASGEDIDLRLRLREAGRQLGVSTTTFVRHRFRDNFAFARDQWLQDGAGLALNIRKHPRWAGWLVASPLLATGRGAGLALLGAPRYLPYWAAFFFYNYRALFKELLRPADGGLSLGGNAVWLTAARVAPMAAGLLFWGLAAMLLAPPQLGLGSAVVASALLTVQIGMLGVGPATLTLLPAQNDRRRRLIATGLLTVGLASIIVAAALLIITRALGPGVGQAWDDPAVTAAFLAAAFFASTAYQLDHISVAMSRADLVLVRSVLQAFIQLTVLIVCLTAGYRSVIAVVGAVALGAGASVGLGMRQIHHAGLGPQWRAGARLHEVSYLLSTALRNYPLVLADRAPAYLLPLIVAATLSTSAAATWYVVWMLTSAVFFVPQSAGYSLQAKLAELGPVDLLINRALRISLLLTFAAGAILLAVGPSVLQVLGPQYVPQWVLLPFLVPAVVLSCVTQVYYAVCRVYGRFAEATAVAVLAAVVGLVPAAAAAESSALPGLAALWLLAQMSAAVVAALRLRRLGNGTGGGGLGPPEDLDTAFGARTG
ncbi:glycosyltransferase [Arthrobacter sp. MSA 4-2]|uniref:glycosyltransferase n=1 Tax=Arthrobacter sp. MSA 4-2 TaxID=2794349 RepID=UPI0018E801A5|nr:glycosyltransferase [Arthrobacter sp. MSA 4-2]MBJ2122388.1 glycosyltransferase [Arthrobacter sp. MSA 4-2]